MNTDPIIVERIFDAPVSKVWQAITDKNEMKNWYFDLEEFKAEVGFKFEFSAGEPGKQYLHLCEVTEVIPDKKLTYSWRYDAYPGNSFVTFELLEKGEKTLLKLTHRGVETLAEGGPDFARNNFQTGWNDIVHTGLKNYLEPSS